MLFQTSGLSIFWCNLSVILCASFYFQILILNLPIIPPDLANEKDRASQTKIVVLLHFYKVNSLSLYIYIYIHHCRHNTGLNTIPWYSFKLDHPQIQFCIFSHHWTLKMHFLCFLWHQQHITLTFQVYFCLQPSFSLALLQSPKRNS